MGQCPKCGTDVTSQQATCRTCGTDLSDLTLTPPSAPAGLPPVDDRSAAAQAAAAQAVAAQAAGQAAGQGAAAQTAPQPGRR